MMPSGPCFCRVLSHMVSILATDNLFNLNRYFFIGAVLVIIATLMYTRFAPEPEPEKSKITNNSATV